MTDAPVSTAASAPSSASPEAPANGYSVSLPTFEGPLDLLLHLCQKHELNILDIPIGFVTEKYLEYLKLMQLMSLDVAAEYLLMAATLAHIKSKMLLPQVPAEQQDDEVLGEEEDPREALIRRLLEYQKYKQAAADLAARPTGNDVFLRGAPMENVTAEAQGPAPIAEVSLFALMDAFQRVLERSKVRITHDIVTDRLSITDRINELVDVLRERRRCEFVDLFQTAQTKFDLVITFLALLEMTKLRMTRLFQTDPLAPLYIELSSADGAENPFAEAEDPPKEAVQAPSEDSPLDEAEAGALDAMPAAEEGADEDGADEESTPDREAVQHLSDGEPEDAAEEVVEPEPDPDLEPSHASELGRALSADDDMDVDIEASRDEEKPVFAEPADAVDSMEADPESAGDPSE